jgi:hypothetical protein
MDNFIADSEFQFVFTRNRKTDIITLQKLAPSVSRLAEDALSLNSNCRGALRRRSAFRVWRWADVGSHGDRRLLMLHGITS